MIRRLLASGLVAALLSGAWAPPALAWSQHGLFTWPALAALPEMGALGAVKAESLDDFVAAEGTALEGVLDRHEQWARASLPAYAPRPDSLRWRAEGAADAAERRARFVAALRLNPDARLGLFLQRRVGTPDDARPNLATSAITPLPHEGSWQTMRFVALNPGDDVEVLDVIATASDEPDYGLDIGLWENNDTAHGRQYGFGRQPFGNAALDFATQAPFHMGFYHEPAIVYAAAGFLRRTYPEARIHLYLALAEHALASGHPYWGWRFAGWALHHVQDLTQPYHARVLPGVSTARMLWINALDIVGASGAKNRAVTLVSNRHLALENFQRYALLAAHRGAPAALPLLQALANIDDDATQPQLDLPAVRNVVAREAALAGDAVDAAIAAHLPATYINDPEVEFGAAHGGANLYAELSRDNPAARDALAAVLEARLRRLAVHTRALVRTLLRPR